jgi:hypothetical protein
MTVTITVDRVAVDHRLNEYVLYFVEDGPWQGDAEGLSAQLLAIQDRVLSAVDAAIDGGLAKLYPDSVGMNVRVQVDSPHGCPQRLQDLVDALQSHVKTDATYASALRDSEYVSAIRIVTGHQLGRFAPRVDA